MMGGPKRYPLELTKEVGLSPHDIRPNCVLARMSGVVDAGVIAVSAFLCAFYADNL
jgi:hypothetical protein